MGISGLKALRRLDLKIPGEIAVIAFDDHDLFELHKPAITAIYQPVDQISNQVINILLDKMDSGGKHKEEQNLVLPTEMIIRESTNAPADPGLNLSIG